MSKSEEFELYWGDKKLEGPIVSAGFSSVDSEEPAIAISIDPSKMSGEIKLKIIKEILK